MFWKLRKKVGFYTKIDKHFLHELVRITWKHKQ